MFLVPHPILLHPRIERYDSFIDSSLFHRLKKRIARATDGPGVYRWLDAEGQVLYVGKAKNVRNRLKSYVQKQEKDVGPWKRALLERIADFDVTVTGSETEALVLETNYIKELRPKYNVLMKDDKNYVYVKITRQEAYPALTVERGLHDDGSLFFGPFLSAYDLRKTLEMLQLLFAYKACPGSVAAMNRGLIMDSCDKTVTTKGRTVLCPNSSVLCPNSSVLIPSFRPCLESQIGQCNGLCAGKISREDYRARMDQVIAFFRGDYATVKREATALMQRYSAEKKFERAIQVRDAIKAIASMEERQTVSDASGEDTDAVGIALLSGKVQVTVLCERGGRVVQERSFALAGSCDDVADALEQFLPQYYTGIIDLPSLILLPASFEGSDALAVLLCERRRAAVEIRIPERGKKVRLLDLAQRNAEEKARQAQASWEAEERNVTEALAGLQTLLDLPSLPARIECYDISHHAGTETVASMAVFRHGKAANREYRHFTIQSLRSGEVDDYRSLQEVVRRRLRHIAGGLKREAEQWRNAGVEIGKSRKEDDDAIKHIVARYPQELSQSALSYKQFLVARHESEIIGFVRLRRHDGGIQELSSLWVDEAFRGQRLAQFLAKSLLATIKKGKIYVRCDPPLEGVYLALGFRPVHKSPAVFVKRFEAYKHDHPDAVERLVMVYEIAKNKADASLAAVPDLLLIDGGKGQLSSVGKVFEDSGIAIPVIAIAKREEEIFSARSPRPLPIVRASPAHFLLMRLRDEAHRFANRLRQKQASVKMFS